MKKNLITIFAVLVVSNILIINNYAQQITSKEDGFSVWFPLEPKVKTSASSVPPYREYSTSNGTIYLSVSVSETRRKVSSDIEKSELYDVARDGSLEHFKGKLLTDKKITLSGRLGRAFSISANSPIGLITISERLFIIGNAFFIVKTITPAKNLQIKTVNKFFNSFKFLD